jgi:EPS-associated MarR family transcriptional regulator
VLLLRTEDSECTLLELLELNPQATQREIASEMGVSLGKVNYCVQALVAKGLVKATNFKNSQRKAAYVYLLTPKGITAKAAISLRYLQRKVQEYEAITAEIDELESDLLAQGRGCEVSGLVAMKRRLQVSVCAAAW